MRSYFHFLWKFLIAAWLLRPSRTARQLLFETAVLCNDLIPTSYFFCLKFFRSNHETVMRMHNIGIILEIRITSMCLYGNKVLWYYTSAFSITCNSFNSFFLKFLFSFIRKRKNFCLEHYLHSTINWIIVCLLCWTAQVESSFFLSFSINNPRMLLSSSLSHVSFLTIMLSALMQDSFHSSSPLRLTV